ncbi:hypothetical protein ABC733_27235 [Mangrovibacter sp. SLW1]
MARIWLQKAHWQPATGMADQVWGTNTKEDNFSGGVLVAYWLVCGFMINGECSIFTWKATAFADANVMSSRGKVVFMAIFLNIRDS